MGGDYSELQLDQLSNWSEPVFCTMPFFSWMLVALIVFLPSPIAHSLVPNRPQLRTSCVRRILPVRCHFSVKHRQPDRRFVGRRPFDPVLVMGRDVHEVAGLHFNGFILESQSSRSLQHNNPFVLVLVVPKPFLR